MPQALENFKHVSVQVSGFSTFLRDMRVALHVKLVKLMASLTIGAKIEKGKANFARVGLRGNNCPEQS